MTDERDIVYRLRKRAEIRRGISTRRSVQEGKPDRLADLLEEAAKVIEDGRKPRRLWAFVRPEDHGEVSWITSDREVALALWCEPNMAEYSDEEIESSLREFERLEKLLGEKIKPDGVAVAFGSPDGDYTEVWVSEERK